MRQIPFLPLASLLCLAHTATGEAQSYSISKFTIAGGGGLNSTGGVYAVSGTIGQPDASGPLSGGTYSLVGGFWALPSAIQPPGAPLLRAQTLAGGSVRIFWPLPATGFQLEQTPVLTNAPGTNDWSQVPFPYSTNATEISITAPSPTGKKFYRLRAP